MSTAISCPACGVVLPGHSGRCPACGARSGRRPMGLYLAIAVGAIVVGAVVGFLVRGGAAAPGPRPTVGITPGISRLSPDAKGTDVVATIDNPNPMPVDFTVRVQGLDIANHIVAEKTLGPYRGLPPGAARDIRHHFTTTPLASVTFEAVDVAPTEPDQP